MIEILESICEVIISVFSFVSLLRWDLIDVFIDGR